MYTLLLLGYLTASFVFTLVHYFDNTAESGIRRPRGEFRQSLKYGLSVIPVFLLVVGVIYLAVHAIYWVFALLFHFLLWTAQNMP